jgi:mRNA-degrading endonuclease RelE of RelBE toxin-antitoxin system
MTIVGSGGVVITQFAPTEKYKKQFKKLPSDIQKEAKEKLKDLLKNPRPPGLRFEKLKGYSNPNIYTIHITGNFKMSFEIKGSVAVLRCVGNHNEIDRRP